MLWIGVVHEYEYGERDAFIAILISRFENLMLVLKVGLEKFLLHFTGSLLQVELNFACSCTCMSDFYHPRAAQKKKRGGVTCISKYMCLVGWIESNRTYLTVL